MAGNAKGKLQEQEKGKEDALAKFRRNRKERVQTRGTEEESVAEKKFANIKENPLYKLMHDANLSPEEKVAAYRKAIAADVTKSAEENRAMQSANEEFKEWLNAWGKTVVKDLIKTAETESAALLQSLIKDTHGSMREFKDLFEPYLLLLDAIHTLNVGSDGQMYDVFNYINDLQAEEVRLEAQKKTLAEEIARAEETAKNRRTDLAVKRADQPGFFGKLMGKEAEYNRTVAMAQQEVEEAEKKIEAKKAELAEVKPTLLADMDPEKREMFESLAPQVKELKKFMELDSDENRQKRQGIIDKALSYVENTDEKSAKVLAELEGLRDKIYQADDASGKLMRAFTIVNEAEAGAVKDGVELSKDFEEAAENETAIDKMDRKKKHRIVNDHVTTLRDAQKLTSNTVLNLADETATIQGLIDSNRRQLRQTKQLNESGVRTVGMRLVTTIDSLSAVALNEGETALRNSMKEMDRLTREAQQNRAMEAALGEHTENEELMNALDASRAALEDAREIMDIREEAARNFLEIERDMAEVTRDFQESVEDAQGLSTKILADRDDVPVAEDEADDAAPSTPGAGLNL